MNDGEIWARHYGTGQAVRAGWRQGIFTQFEAAETSPERDVWLAPALVDPQINGFGGVDFQRDGLTVEAALIAARSLRAAACSRFFLTLVTDEWPKLVNRLKHLRQLRAGHEELRHAIAGWHIEGAEDSAGVIGMRGIHGVDAQVMLGGFAGEVAILDREPVLADAELLHFPAWLVRPIH